MGSTRVRWCHLFGPVWARDGGLSLALGCRILLHPRKIAYAVEEWLLQIVRNLFMVAAVDAENLGIFCYPYVWHYVLQSRELYVCFYVCSLWVSILQAITQAFSGACSLLYKWGFGFFFFWSLYLQSFNYCLVPYCPVLHFRTGHCSLDGHILCERGDRRIFKHIKSQYTI